MGPENTVNRSLKWRVWHSTNYNIGAISFLFGSLLLFPFMATVFPTGVAAQISAWLYTIGSFTFVIADFTQWTHYERKVVCLSGQCCQHLSFSINFLFSFTGSFLYLVGSAFFIPSINKPQQGLYLFIIASIIIVLSQSWKIGRVIKQGYQQNKIQEVIKQDFSGFLVDLFAGFGGLMYCIGSILFFNPDSLIQIVAATIFSTGGFLFYLSGSFMLKRYFLDETTHSDSFHIVNSQARIQEKQMNQTSTQS